MTAIAIQDTLGSTNLTTAKLELIRSLIQQYVPGISNNVFRGIKSLGAEDLVFPCVMIQPVRVESRMITTGRFHRWYHFDIYWWVANDSIEQTVVLVTSLGETFQKLFSNNALGDIGAANTNKFKAYASNWVDSEMTDIRYGPPLYVGGKVGRPKYAALGFFGFKVQTVFVT